MFPHKPKDHYCLNRNKCIQIVDHCSKPPNKSIQGELSEKGINHKVLTVDGLDPELYSDNCT